jgi:anthranilate synthase component 2
MRIVLVDHRDSFAWNLVHLFGGVVGRAPEVVQSAALDVARLLRAAPDLLLLGPGPGHPSDPRSAGRSRELITAARGRVPMFGVCFGLQLLVAEQRGRVVAAAAPMHGKRSRLCHAATGIFAGLPPGVTMMRYHSLVAERSSLPAGTTVIAESESGEVMAIEQEGACAVQFHPESIGSEGGAVLASNVVRWASEGRRR